MPPLGHGFHSILGKRMFPSLILYKVCVSLRGRGALASPSRRLYWAATVISGRAASRHFSAAHVSSPRPPPTAFGGFSEYPTWKALARALGAGPQSRSPPPLELTSQVAAPAAPDPLNHRIPGDVDFLWSLRKITPRGVLAPRRVSAGCQSVN